MSGSKAPSKKRRHPDPLTPEQRYQAGKNLAHVIVVAHEQGAEAAGAEWRRMLAEKRAKAQPRT
jgi:hypothetical protein